MFQATRVLQATHSFYTKERLPRLGTSGRHFEVSAPANQLHISIIVISPYDEKCMSSYDFFFHSSYISRVKSVSSIRRHKRQLKLLSTSCNASWLRSISEPFNSLQLSRFYTCIPHWVLICKRTVLVRMFYFLTTHAL